MTAIKSDTDSDSDEQKKVARFFRKKRGVTPSVAAPGVTHPSDATGRVSSGVARICCEEGQRWKYYVIGHSQWTFRPGAAAAR